MASDIEIGHLIHLNWFQIKIDEKKFSYKSKFNENSFEILLFDWAEFKLFYLKQEENQILECFKVNAIYSLLKGNVFLLRVFLYCIKIH